MEGGGEHKPREEEEGKAVNGSVRDEEEGRCAHEAKYCTKKKRKKKSRETLYNLT